MGLLVLCICVGGYIVADWYQVTPDVEPRKFVGRQTCIECHQTEANLFHGSHHDLAMDVASNETVLGDFDNAELEHFGITSRFFRDGEKFMVHTEGEDGQLHDFEVKYVFGVEPLQQYMVEFGRDDAEDGEIGRVQVLRLSWDTKAKKWFYLRPPDVDQKLEPGDPLHWTGITQCWNTSCADCHSTNVKKNYHPLSRSYKTTFSEIDVSCEACHGPGSFHVKLARQKSLFWDRKHGFGLTKLKTDSNRPQVETCAPCHSRRTQIQEGFQAGCNFDDYYACRHIADQIYHDDGQIRDEVYVYGSFIQSKMYHNGIRCSDCHDPHSTKVKYNDNRLCTSCHQHPAGKYDTINHHHHTPGTAGSNCVDCHMPATTYMMVDPRRDHSLRVPRPDVSVLTGTPNACTGCHLDSQRLPIEDRRELRQYLDWIVGAESGNDAIQAELSRVNRVMADAFLEWYGQQPATPRTTYYQQMANGKSDNPDSVATLRELAVDRSAPAFFRASAMLELADQNDSQIQATAKQGLQDRDANVVASSLVVLEAELARKLERSRYSATDRTDELQELTELIAAQLGHPSIRVRIEAARIFAGIPRSAVHQFATSTQRREFESAIDDFKKALLINDERGVTHARLGSLYEQLGEIDKAEDAYRTAMMVEPDFVGARSNLAALLDGELRELRRQLVPNNGQAFSPAQLKSVSDQANRIATEVYQLRKDEFELLKRDLKRGEGLPGTHALHYRFAMAAYLQGQLPLTEKHLLIAHQQLPDNPSYLLGLATYYRQNKEPEKAVSYVNRLIELDRENPGFRSLAKALSEELNLKKQEKSKKE